MWPPKAAEIRYKLRESEEKVKSRAKEKGHWWSLENSKIISGVEDHIVSYFPEWMWVGLTAEVLSFISSWGSETQEADLQNKHINK
jgi:hypothetical protein